MEYDALSVQDKKDNHHKQSLMLLLKCLKIMENATFLSIDNQVSLIYNKVLDILMLISCYQVAVYTTQSEIILTLTLILFVRIICSDLRNV